MAQKLNEKKPGQVWYPKPLELHAKMKKVSSFGFQHSHLTFNKKYRLAVISTKYILTILSFFISVFILDFYFALFVSLVTYVLLETLSRFGFYHIENLQYPVVDDAKFPIPEERNSSGFLGYNKYKDTGQVDESYPDNICGVCMNFDGFVESFRAWINSLTKGRIDDREKTIRMKIIISDNHNVYFVLIMINRDAPHLVPLKKKILDGVRKIDSDLDAYLNIHGTKFVERYEVSPGNESQIEEFLGAYNGDNRCALAFGLDGSRICKDIFVVNEFDVLMESELDRTSYEFALLRRYGWV